MLQLLYPVIPDNTEQAISQACKFLNGGEIKQTEEDDNSNHRYFSFSKDQRYIFAAFKQTHNVDLEITELHWWKFVSLFMDLGSNTFFCQLTGLRKRVKTGKATKEERELSREMGAMFEIEDLDTRTVDERIQESEFMRLVHIASNNNGQIK